MTIIEAIAAALAQYTEEPITTRDISVVAGSSRVFAVRVQWMDELEGFLVPVVWRGSREPGENWGADVEQIEEVTFSQWPPKHIGQ